MFLFLCFMFNSAVSLFSSEFTIFAEFAGEVFSILLGLRGRATTARRNRLGHNMDADVPGFPHFIT
jgi:hypothetical protein